jgi:glutathione S-transferase
VVPKFTEPELRFKIATGEITNSAISVYLGSVGHHGRFSEFGRIPLIADESHTLYGAYASFYTAKTRSYLRKKAIPFVERLPSDPHFRKRIPIFEAADGTIVQDTTEIFEYLEPRYPSRPALPPGPCQRFAAYLIDLFASENMRIAWHYRWNFPEQNLFFVTMDFGRSFKPQGSDAELKHYGDIIAQQMDGHRPNFGITPELYPALEAIYFDLLDGLEKHFTTFLYLFGGLPSIGDYALMGPLFGHLGRDPHPRSLMQERAVRVFRWTEHMNTPEICSPEFPDTPIAYLPDDAVPETVCDLVRLLCSDYAAIYRETAKLYADWAKANSALPAGSIISQEGRDQPSLGKITVPLRNKTITMASQLHSLWLLQRMLNRYRDLAAVERDKVERFADSCGAASLLSIEIARPLMRVRNRLAVG